MICVNNGSQGIYVAGEGLEQKLFQVGDNLLMFDGEICPRLVRSVEAYKDNVDALVNKIAQEYDKGKVIVCSSEAQKVFAVGKRQIYDVSQGYKSNDVCVNFSGSSLNDFVDFVEHSESTQFGFVINKCASVLLSENVSLTQPTQLYRDEHLALFSKIALSYFNAFVNEHPQELRVYLQNLCTLDVGEVCKIIASSDKQDSASYDEAVSTLLHGTSYYKNHQKLLKVCNDLFGIYNQTNELHLRNGALQDEIIEKNDVICNNYETIIAQKDMMCNQRDEIIFKMYAVIKKLDSAFGAKRVVEEKQLGSFDRMFEKLLKQYESRNKISACANETLI